MKNVTIIKTVKNSCFILAAVLLIELSLAVAYAADRAEPPPSSQNPGVSYTGKPGGASAADTQTSNVFFDCLINGDDFDLDGSDDYKDNKYSDPWPWWRKPTWRYGRGYPWRRGSGRGPGWGSPPIGNPASDSFTSADSKDDKQTQQDYEDEIYQRVLRDEWARRKKRWFPTFPNRRFGPFDKLPGPPGAPGGNYDDATLVAMGYKDWYDTFGLPIPGLDALVNILKPNIYLYNDISLEVAVAFEYPELLTVSIPDYNDGWKVVVSEDGTLADKNGSYGFLFYESISNLSDFQMLTGFRLGVEDRERRFHEILDLYCFNETEKADFIEFWTEVLDPGLVYVMYPQGTDILDRVMPVFTYPGAVNLFRLWFGFEAADITVDAPAIETITRGGLTLVEWGGFIVP